MHRRTLSILLTALIASLPVLASAAELRSGSVRYDGGAAQYQVAESQHVICDDCPPRQLLAPAPVKPPTPEQPIAPEKLSVEGVIPSPFDSPWHASSEKAVPPATILGVTSHQSHPLATVYFTLNSIRLRTAEKRRLRAVVAGGLDSEVVVRVEAHTCRIGTAAFNKKLSTRRAQAVSSYLKSLGIPVREVVGLGKTQPLGGPLPKDRRAEIIIKERNYIP